MVPAQEGDYPLTCWSLFNLTSISGDKPDGGGGSGVISGLGNHDGPVVYSTDGTCGPKNRGTFCSANSDAYNVSAPTDSWLLQAY